MNQLLMRITFQNNVLDAEVGSNKLSSMTLFSEYVKELYRSVFQTYYWSFYDTRVVLGRIDDVVLNVNINGENVPFFAGSIFMARLLPDDLLSPSGHEQVSKLELQLPGKSHLIHVLVTKIVDATISSDQFITSRQNIIGIAVVAIIVGLADNDSQDISILNITVVPSRNEVWSSLEDFARERGCRISNVEYFPGNWWDQNNVYSFSTPHTFKEEIGGARVINVRVSMEKSGDVQVMRAIRGSLRSGFLETKYVDRGSMLSKTKAYLNNLTLVRGGYSALYTALVQSSC
jgi:hypothetical protein